MSHPKSERKDVYWSPGSTRADMSLFVMLSVGAHSALLMLGFFIFALMTLSPNLRCQRQDTAVVKKEDDSWKERDPRDEAIAMVEMQIEHELSSQIYEVASSMPADLRETLLGLVETELYADIRTLAEGTVDAQTNDVTNVAEWKAFSAGVGAAIDRQIQAMIVEQAMHYLQCTGDANGPGSGGGKGAGQGSGQGSGKGGDAAGGGQAMPVPPEVMQKYRDFAVAVRTGEMEKARALAAELIKLTGKNPLDAAEVKAALTAALGGGEGATQRLARTTALLMERGPEAVEKWNRGVRARITWVGEDLRYLRGFGGSRSWASEADNAMAERRDRFTTEGTAGGAVDKAAPGTTDSNLFRRVALIAPIARPFGVAAHIAGGMTIDGNLDDWADIPVLNFRGVHAERPNCRVVWDEAGLYFAFNVTNKDARVTRLESDYWLGEALEIWIDERNLKHKVRREGDGTHQYYLWPFDETDFARETGIAPAYVKTPIDGASIRKATQMAESGWTAEVFISANRLPKLKLREGTRFGMDVAVSDGVSTEYWTGTYYHSWNQPDAWGDIVLSGTPAVVELSCDDPEVAQHGRGLGFVLVGRALTVRVTHPAQNRNSAAVETTTIRLSSEAGDDETLTLRETGAGTGVFAGVIQTRLFAGVNSPGVLDCREGDSLRALYTDRGGGQAYAFTAVASAVFESSGPIVQIQ